MKNDYFNNTKKIKVIEHSSCLALDWLESHWSFQKQNHFFLIEYVRHLYGSFFLNFMNQKVDRFLISTFTSN